VLATQNKTVRAVSPWQDDPYNATQFVVPMLALVVALRLLAWRALSYDRRGVAGRRMRRDPPHRRLPQRDVAVFGTYR
jgi:hypothetical protein